MKKISRRAAALLLMVLLLLSLLPGADAADDIYFVAVNDQLMDLNQETMPFWSGGELYISSAVFRSPYASSIGVSFSPGTNRETAILYNLKNALFFDMVNHTAYDTQNNYYPARAIDRGNYVFFPLSLVAAFFQISYRVIPTEPAPVIRLKNGDANLSDSVFCDAAALLMQSRYDSYVRSQEPETPDKEPETLPPAPVYSGQQVYLVFSFTGAESTGTLLDTLSRYGCSATFLMSPSEIEENHDLTRRLSAEGHAIAIDVTGAENAEAAFAAGCDALFDAARITTRLVWGADNVDGGKTVDCRLDRSRRPLTSTARANDLYETIAGSSVQKQTIYLGADSDNTAGLSRLLSQLSSLDCQLPPYRETL